MWEILDDDTLSMVLCYLDDNSSLITVSKSWSIRFLNEKLWLEICSIKWGSINNAQNKFNYAYFNKYAISFKTLSKFSTLQGIYSVFDAYPFGIGIRFMLRSEKLFEAYVIDSKSLTLLFQIILLPNGKHQILPGVVLNMEIIDTFINSKQYISEISNRILPSALKHCKKWSPENSLKHWNIYINSIYKIHRKQKSNNLIGKGSYGCSSNNNLTIKSPYVLLSISPTPIIEECYCGGPFESILPSYCGCSDSKWSMLQYLIARGTSFSNPSSSSLSSASSSSLSFDQETLTLLKCGELTCQTYQDKPLLYHDIQYIPPTLSSNSSSKFKHEIVTAFFLYPHKNLKSNNNNNNNKENNIENNENLESGYYIMNQAVKGMTSKHDEQLISISSHCFEVSLSELLQEINTNNEVNIYNNDDDDDIFQSDINNNNVYKSNHYYNDCHFSIVDKIINIFNLNDSIKIKQMLNKYIMNYLIDMNLKTIDDSSVFFSLTIGIKVSGDWKVPMGEICFIVINQQNAFRRHMNKTSSLGHHCDLDGSMCGTTSHLLSGEIRSAYMRTSHESWLSGYFTPIYDDDGKAAGWQCSLATEVDKE